MVEVEKRVSDDEDIELRYYWHNIYYPITYKNGEKGPIIHSNILSKYRKHDQYYLEELFIKISKDKYETLKRFEDDAFQFAGKDEKSYISALQRNKKIIQNLSVKSYNEGNLDQEFSLACRIE